MTINIKEGQTFSYKTSGGDVGSIYNVNHRGSIEIDVEEIGGSYHVSVMIDNVYIQIWCTSYEIRSGK